MSRVKKVLWLGILVWSAVQALAQQPFLGSCGEDAAIDAAKKKAIDSAALNFVQAVFAGSASSSAAFDSMSKTGQAETSQQQMAAAIAAIRLFEASNVALQNTYLIRLMGKSPGRVVCGDLSSPESWESLAAQDVPEQAHVLLSADTRNNKLAITVWLVPEQGKWKVNSFRVNVSSLADKDSFQLWQMARAQQARQHTLNAALLYSAAAQAAERGPNFQLGITQSLSEDIAGLSVPAEIRDQPPFLWKDGEATYTVRNVSPVAIGGKIYLAIVHEASFGQSDAQMDAWNKQLLKYFKQRFPEYSDVFAGLVARAVERGGNRGYGTVDELPSQK
jgi:hypothetical protein